MKSYFTLFLVFGFCQIGMAQVDDSLDLDLDPVISEDISVDSKPTESLPKKNINSEVKQNRSIYIVNQTSSGSASGAENKAEQSSSDTAIVGSRADELRKNRQRAELETELKATEKIEESRLNDERRRNDVLFGERYKDLDSSSRRQEMEDSAARSPKVKAGMDREELREELKSVLSEKEANKKSYLAASNSYFIGMMGLTEFPKADNIQGNGIFGVGLGVESQGKVLIEGMFQYGSYEKTYFRVVNIEEYSGIGAVKFQFNRGLIRPVVGALAVYSYRTYTDQVHFQSVQYHSSVLDAGLLGGAQFGITEDFSLGAEFRYLWNLTSKTDGIYTTFFPNEVPLDQLNHYVLAITGRFNF